MTRDWVDWHAQYEQPGSALSRRLRVVQRCVDHALHCLVTAPTVSDEIRVISLCSGDSRDLLPVLARHDHGVPVRALAVELDPGLVEVARRSAARWQLSGVDVVCGDAGDTTAFAGIAPADLVLACGVFGNITAADGRRTVAALRGLTKADGFVIWTRASAVTSDPSSDVRGWFRAERFTERLFIAPADAAFRVGMNQLTPAGAKRYRPGVRMFTFTQM